MKKGDNLRFNGDTPNAMYSHMTVGKLYTIKEVTSDYAVVESDRGRDVVWSYSLGICKDAFTLVQAPEKDAQALKEGDVIKFMGAPANVARYIGTTVGKEYTIFRVVRDVEGNVVRVQYLDNDGDEISWHPNRYTDMYFFKVMNDGGLYKDDALATAPTVQDLQSTLDLALLLHDIQWAQDIYQQIQLMEGEHA